MSSETSVMSASHGMWASLRQRLAKRPDSEHGQALIRIVICSTGFLYVLFMHADEKLTAAQFPALVVTFCALLAAIGVFLLIVIQPKESLTRRLLSMTLDFGSLSYFMYVLGDKGTLFFSVYLWVAIGYGLRYGLRYLHTAMAASIVSFGAVIVSSAYWREQWGFSTGLLVGLVALPLYFSSLLKRLSNQNNELKKLYEQMAMHATYDSLTKLPNRKHFHDHLAEAIASARRNNRPFAILYLDLDGFKAINDALGHRVGDQVIESTARRLERCVRNGDMVARVGGDEFVVLLRDAVSNNIAKVAENIIETLSEPFTIAANTLFITTSIGAATYPQDGPDANTLIHNADSAMYDAKRNGKNGYRICNSKLSQTATNVAANAITAT